MTACEDSRACHPLTRRRYASGLDPLAFSVNQNSRLTIKPSRLHHRQAHLFISRGADEEDLTACKVMQQRCSFKRVRPSGSWIPAAADLAICFRCLVTKPGPHHPRRQNEIQCPLPETLLITPYQLAPSLLIDASQVVEPITTHLAVDCPLAASLVSSCSLAHGL
ncbi:uncharacterized [Tachysurus ichikawai]